MVLNEVVTFKIATYSTAKDKLYFNDILHRGKFLGIKFWSHSHTIITDGNGSNIKDTITFTTKNKSLDKLYNIILRIVFYLRSIKYKIFFLKEETK